MAQVQQQNVQVLLFMTSCPHPYITAILILHCRGAGKKMCTSCERCKVRDEYSYKHLDDAKKHFLVLMLGDFLDEMVTLLFPLMFLLSTTSTFSI